MQPDAHHDIGIRHGGKQRGAFFFKILRGAGNAPLRVAGNVKEFYAALSQFFKIFPIDNDPVRRVRAHGDRLRERIRLAVDEYRRVTV